MVHRLLGYCFGILISAFCDNTFSMFPLFSLYMIQAKTIEHVNRRFKAILVLQSHRFCNISSLVGMFYACFRNFHLAKNWKRWSKETHNSKISIEKMMHVAMAKI